MRLCSTSIIYTVRVTTPQLWQPRHTDGHRALAELVLQLRDQSGMDFARIADELNSSGQLSPRGKPFYTELVYSIYRKWTRKLSREAQASVVRLADVSLLLNAQ
jgi:hypothetical protein